MNGNIIKRALKVAAYGLLLITSGCKIYSELTPRKIIEGDHAANYRRVFNAYPPADVTVLNSIIIGYSTRPGVVTTDDFEFELLAPPARLAQWEKQFYLREGSDHGIAVRKNNPIRTWYAPKDLSNYRSFRDSTSVGYVHMLVDRDNMDDGRIRVFISKH